MEPCFHKIRTPKTILDRCLNPAPSLSALLDPAPITAFVGSGGKTSTMLALASELCALGASVIVTTTTHIFPVAEPYPRGLQVCGLAEKSGKLGPPAEALSTLAAQCDFLFYEADGSRGLPIKAPAEHEPALLPPSISGLPELVIAALGLSAVGHPLGLVSHRPELVSTLLKKDPDALVTPEDCARLLSSDSGQRKGLDGRRYAVVLNQADNDAACAAAKEIISFLPEDIPLAVTAYDQDRIRSIKKDML
ncbi:MAG: putative selenium-dependent hydroxylase accessory protein YqeC [Clostridia bacterium]|nr:putative selenium-dependent hydroxylase accessory protein YqeC [Clostridia bacterium]